MVDTRDGQQVRFKKLRRKPTNHHLIALSENRPHLDDNNERHEVDSRIRSRVRRSRGQVDIDAVTKRVAENIVNRLETKKCLFVNVKETISGPTPAAS
jgi:hypothetical protein